MSLIPTSTPLTHYKFLSFDIYGTLIDEQTGILTGLLSTPHLTSLPPTHPFKASDGGAHHKTLLQHFAALERQVQEAHPTMLYRAVLQETYTLIVKNMVEKGDIKAAEADETSVREAGRVFGASIPSWPAFPDTLDALNRLARYYTLAPLSNIDNASLKATLNAPQGLKGAPFAKLYTAEDIGSYKPDFRNFFYLFDHAGADFPSLFGLTGNEATEEKRERVRGRLLHVAQGVWHDHMPAKELGFDSVWVDRGGAEMGVVDEKVLRERCRFNWRVGSLGEFADLVEEAWGREGRGG